MAEHAVALCPPAPTPEFMAVPTPDAKWLVWDWQQPDGSSRLLYVDRTSGQKTTGPWHSTLDAVLWNAQVRPAGPPAGDTPMAGIWEAAVLVYETIPSHKSEITVFLLAPLHGCEDMGWTFHPVAPTMTSWVECTKDVALQSLNTCARITSCLRPSRWTPMATFLDINLKEAGDAEIYKQKTIQDMRKLPLPRRENTTAPQQLPHSLGSKREITSGQETPMKMSRLEASLPTHPKGLDTHFPPFPGPDAGVHVSPTQPYVKASQPAAQAKAEGPPQREATPVPWRQPGPEANADLTTGPRPNPNVAAVFGLVKGTPTPFGTKGLGKNGMKGAPPPCDGKGMDNSVVVWTGSGKGLQPALCSNEMKPGLFATKPGDDDIVMSQMTVAGEYNS